MLLMTSCEAHLMCWHMCVPPVHCVSVAAGCQHRRTPCCHPAAHAGAHVWVATADEDSGAAWAAMGSGTTSNGKAQSSDGGGNGTA